MKGGKKKWKEVGRQEVKQTKKQKQRKEVKVEEEGGRRLEK